MPRPRRFDVVVFGSKSPRWAAALGESMPVWSGFDIKDSVSLKPDGWTPSRRPLRSARRQLVLPLREENVLACPTGCWALVPSRSAVRILSDKRRFARFAEAEGLADLVPARYRPKDAQFPAVLKRTDLCSAQGIAVANSRRELAGYRKQEMWAGKPVVIQQAVPGRKDYSTYCVAVKGRIVWHHTYEFDLEHDLAVRALGPDDAWRSCEATAAELRQLERFLRPLRYSGPVNFDYKRGPKGVVVFEINPRFGGSLFRERNVAELRACVAAIAAHARWRPHRRAAHVPSRLDVGAAASELAA
jgi:carbamoylphosphate synthase large subunit